MKLIITSLVGMMVPAAALLGQNQVCLPQFIDGHAGPYRWETTLVIQNQERRQAEVHLRFYDGQGGSMQGLTMRGPGGHGPLQPIGPDGHFAPGPMHRRGMQTYRSGGGGPLRTGFCLAESPDQVRMHARLRLYDGSGDVVSETSVTPGPQFRFGSFWMDHTEGQGVGLALTHPGPAERATVTIEIFQQDGTLLGSTEVQVGPHSQIAQLLAELFPGILSGDVGYIVISSDQAICALALQLRGFRMFQIPVYVLAEAEEP